MSKKSRSDLLVRVRYLNPLPPPPFPPKLLEISTDINRLAEPSYLDHLAASTPLPMLVDSEMGMPLDLNLYDGVWEGHVQALNPVPNSSRALDPVDAMLLGPISRLAANSTEQGSATTEVSWMRAPNLFTRKANARRREGHGSAKAEAAIDASEAAQIMAIDKSFADVSQQKVQDVRHPESKKRHLEVVETYDILPDEETWANMSCVVRYPECPSGANVSNCSAEASSSRLARSFLRVRPSDDEDGFLDYFLPHEQDLERIEQNYEHAISNAVWHEVGEFVGEDPSDARIDQLLPNVRYERIRPYEIVSQLEPDKKFLLAIEETEGANEMPAKRRKGAYYKPIEVWTILRKTRANRGDINEQDSEWDNTRIGYRVAKEEERVERTRKVGQVADPNWINERLRALQGGENMAEGLGEAIDDEEEPYDARIQKVEEELDEDD